MPPLTGQLALSTIALWRPAAHMATSAHRVRSPAVFRRFQLARLDAGLAARMVVELPPGFAGKPFVAAIDRTNWDSCRTTINILMISVQWRGVGVPIIWTLPPTAGNSSTARSRADLLNRLRSIFPDMKIAWLTGVAS